MGSFIDCLCNRIYHGSLLRSNGHAHDSLCCARLVATFVQKLLSPREGYDIVQRPTIQKMGLQWYLTYAGLLTFIHHFVLFFAETLRLTPFFYHIGHILFSSIATLLLMTIGQYLIFAQKGNE